MWQISFFPVEHSVPFNIHMFFAFTREEVFDINSPVKVYNLHLIETSCHTPPFDKFLRLLRQNSLKAKSFLLIIKKAV